MEDCQPGTGFQCKPITFMYSHIWSKPLKTNIFVNFDQHHIIYEATVHKVEAYISQSHCNCQFQFPHNKFDFAVELENLQVLSGID